jgi:cell division protein ZapE
VTGPRAEYERRVASGALERDAAQQPAVDELERLYRELDSSRRRERSMIGRLGNLFGRSEDRIRGVYLFGNVGRGKTALIDLFFHSLPFPEKQRLHFHRFMALVHERLRALRDAENPLELAADRIAAECRIICFDELFVSDIADAMILGNLFSALFQRGVTLAATSNSAPGELYRDGLQRQRFLPAIDAIESNTVIVELAGNRDYRLGVLEGDAVFLSPADHAAERRLEAFFSAIAPDEVETAGAMEILGRPIEYLRRSDGVVWLEFDAICDGPRSQDDYIELAREYQTVVVSRVPQFGPDLENQARRFIALVDEFYDRRVKLILSAEVPLAALYRGRRLESEFRRTSSRLIEMQGHEYLAAAHRP